MIVWLASYPRSGNTLLRTALKQTMNLNSCADEIVNSLVNLPSTVKQEYGHWEVDEPFDEFYLKAKESEEIFLIKTHLPPRDNSPAIYIVRDGRSALFSYFEYHKKYIPDLSLNLIELILGKDFYGGWSDHYKMWMSNGRNNLLLRYENLVGEISQETLKSIAKFIGYSGLIQPWVNPFLDLNKINPSFFRKGQSTWVRPHEWTQKINLIFFLIHGRLMAELGYASNGDLNFQFLDIEDRTLVEVATSAIKKQKDYQKICTERLQVINILDKELKRLRNLGN